MLSKDYNKLYKLQDNILLLLSSVQHPFYLTGGTALGRFYLHHRNSEDLDFFTNENKDFKKLVLFLLEKINNSYELDTNKIIVNEDFAHLIIQEGPVFLKIEFVNDVKYMAGSPIKTQMGLIDCPLNILANKITAVVGRDEPKDIFDIVYLAKQYQFNWLEIFSLAKQKAFINEIEVEQRLRTFPVEFIANVDWLIRPFEFDDFQRKINQLTDDFILGKDNSLSESNILLNNAVPELVLS